jgi:hypothetical protein
MSLWVLGTEAYRVCHPFYWQLIHIGSLVALVIFP